MSYEPHDYLRHILVEVDYLLATRSDLTFGASSSNETLQRAFVRSFEIIGEAVKRVPNDFREDHSKIDWRACSLVR